MYYFELIYEGLEGFGAIGASVWTVYSLFGISEIPFSDPMLNYGILISLLFLLSIDSFLSKIEFDFGIRLTLFIMLLGLEKSPKFYENLFKTAGVFSLLGAYI